MHVYIHIYVRVDECHVITITMRWRQLSHMYICIYTVLFVCIIYELFTFDTSCVCSVYTTPYVVITCICRITILTTLWDVVDMTQSFLGCWVI
jgi:hypothetical protein